MVVFTFSVLYWKHSFWQMEVKEVRLLSMRPYETEIGSCRQHSFFNLLR